MSDLSHIIGNDLSLSASGGTAIVTGAEQTRQSVLRRLGTNIGDYIWQTGYGAGLPARVGGTVDTAGIHALVMAQMAQETGVDQTRPIGVNVAQATRGQVRLDISYTDATGSVQALSLQSD
ncbi:phage tail protein [Komagataeibacter sp. FNDCR2]|uniref:phage tail protein n=1 Tax=Komagataeibacter sp. FNDCR2 TaxID=2878682 RepID=UPI001E2D6B62|nr:phage tail protein [Komagataeibacter sp. FNDCR2]MCE2574390.1 phage tail protein [Komagataeibacter sp. FNDCR2]